MPAENSGVCTSNGQVLYTLEGDADPLAARERSVDLHVVVPACVECGRKLLLPSRGVCKRCGDIVCAHDSSCHEAHAGRHVQRDRERETARAAKGKRPTSRRSDG